MFSDMQKNSFLKVLMLSSFILPVRRAYGWRELRNTGGMILTGEDRLIGENQYHAPPSTTNLTWTGAGSNLASR